MANVVLPETLPRPLRVILASSGGADSLGALAWLHQQRLSGLIDELTVVSIDHQLHPDSAKWSARACAQADFFSIDSTCISIEVPSRGIHGQHSLEARARWARYEALTSWMRDNYTRDEEPVLVTAHHLEDQVETFLLAALRGSGAAGLSAMPILTRLGSGWHWRPFLSVPREQLRQYGAGLPLIPVEDPSNQDLSYDRNYLRAEIVPRIVSRWPQSLAGLARSASQAAEDRLLLESLAAIDAPLENSERLPLAPWLHLEPARQANVIRTWVKQHNALMPPRRRLAEFLRQIKVAEADQYPELAWGEWKITRYRDALWWRSDQKLSRQHDVLWRDKKNAIKSTSGGVFCLVRTKADDPLAIGERWVSKDWVLRGRRPGDRIQPKGSTCSRSLKNWFQEQDCPPWVRKLVTIVEIDQHLACIVGWGVDRQYAPEPSEPAWRVVLKNNQKW